MSTIRDQERQEREYWDWMTQQTITARRKVRQREVHVTIRRGASAAKRRARR